ncbi:acyltransferase, partial [Streptomyces brasiliscabiei]
MPLYWAVTLGFCALGLTTHLFRHFAVTPADLVRSLLFIPYVNPQGRVWPIVIPGWTLDFEMAFYGLFAIG